MGIDAPRRTEDISGEIEHSHEADIERIEKAKSDIRDALLFIACADADGFDSCVKEWFGKNDEKFEESFAQLLDTRPNLIEEWETDDPQTRSEILDTLNGVLLKDGSEMSAAA